MTGDEYEAIMSYNDIMTQLNDDEDELHVWKFMKTVNHQQPLSTKYPTYK